MDFGKQEKFIFDYTSWRVNYSFSHFLCSEGAGPPPGPNQSETLFPEFVAKKQWWWGILEAAVDRCCGILFPGTVVAESIAWTSVSQVQWWQKQGLDWSSAVWATLYSLPVFLLIFWWCFYSIVVLEILWANWLSFNKGLLLWGAG